MSPGPGEPAPVPPPARPAGSRYGWFVGVVGFLVIVYITLNTALTPSRGSRGVPAGSRLPAFAVPLATGSLTGDADVATRPNQGAAGRVPACQLRGPQILNSCQLAEQGPVALGLFVPVASCATILDELATLRRAYPAVQYAAVAIRGDRSTVRRLVRRHRWPFPVGYDHDGAVAIAYDMAVPVVCSQITFAGAGGRVRGSSLLGTPALGSVRARLAALAPAGRRRAPHGRSGTP